jgi:hypothetical protein
MGTSTIIPSCVFLWNSKKTMKVRRGVGERAIKILAWGRN